MPFESLVDDEMSMMEDQLNESGRALETHEIQVPLGSIMHHVPSVLSGASVQDVINLMVSHDVGSIFVVSDEKLKGIIGERDILLKVLNKLVDYANLTVDHFMKSDPLSLNLKIYSTQPFNIWLRGGFGIFRLSMPSTAR